MLLELEFEILYKLQLVPRACTSYKSYKQVVQVATHTRFGVQVVTYAEFHHDKIPTCTILLYQLDLKTIIYIQYIIFHKIINTEFTEKVINIWILIYYADTLVDHSRVRLHGLSYRENKLLCSTLSSA